MNHPDHFAHKLTVKALADAMLCPRLQNLQPSLELEDGYAAAALVLSHLL